MNRKAILKGIREEAAKLGADAWVLGAGTCSLATGLKFAEHKVHGLGSDFVREYQTRHATHDIVAGIVSTATPGAVAYCPSDYLQKGLPGDVQEIGFYLRRYGILAFMVVGVRSGSSGFGWITLYRRRKTKVPASHWPAPPRPATLEADDDRLPKLENKARFNSKDRELASFRFGELVCQWQRRRAEREQVQEAGKVSEEEAALLKALLWLDRPAVEILMLQTMGYSFDEINARLDKKHESDASSSKRKRALKALAKHAKCTPQAAERRLRHMLFAPGTVSV